MTIRFLMGWVFGIRHLKDQLLSTKEIYVLHRDKGQRLRDKDRRGQGRRWKGIRKRGKGYFFLFQRSKRLPLDREETGVAARQMAVYEGKRGNYVSGGGSDQVKEWILLSKSFLQGRGSGGQGKSCQSHPCRD